ncbi:alpha/beta fold hydrolase [Paenibacillus soyae]|uniref:Alpha/beta hydrolase n=1 Tax=Paenibacillus soyae TaxID=2969249 RepID=A0A9X2MNP9_9BACL|nr:alpha/beta hydrolase [Paenibacillus soyae]MCR2804099.1 alpha/beta hydrolase [Paenibacillus soyae]
MPYASVNGTKLYYRVRGQGIPIVCIHPPLLTSANFHYQAEQLSDEYRVITFDIRGHGSSEESATSITYPLIAEDIRQLLDYLGIDKAILCGYSTGGTVALEAMLAYPDRFHGGILLSAMSEASDFVLRNRIRIAIGLSAWKSAIRLLMLAITWGNSDSSRTYRRMIKRTRLGSPRNIHQFYRCSLAYNCTERLSRIAAPMLLIYGEKDWGFKRYRRKLMEGLRYASLVILDKKKHQLPTKAASEIHAAIRDWVSLRTSGRPTSTAASPSLFSRSIRRLRKWNRKRLSSIKQQKTSPIGGWFLVLWQ